MIWEKNKKIIEGYKEKQRSNKMWIHNVKKSTYFGMTGDIKLNGISQKSVLEHVCFKTFGMSYDMLEVIPIVN